MEGDNGEAWYSAAISLCYIFVLFEEKRRRKKEERKGKISTYKTAEMTWRWKQCHVKTAMASIFCMTVKRRSLLYSV